MAQLGGRTLAVHGDIDGDGDWDIVIGVPDVGCGTIFGSGQIEVWYGGSYSGPPDEVWSRDSPGVSGASECDAGFGASVAVGDFNADGYADIAVGVPGDAASGDRAGTVHILYGSSAGLTAAGNQIYSQDSPGINGVSEAFDAFGTAMVAADFNCDGYADLAIGVPGEEVGGVSNAGAVNILYGSASGLSATGNQLLDQNSGGSTGIPGTPEAGDHFGAYLSAGNVDGDDVRGRPCYDLAIAVPRKDIGGARNAGMVNVVYGGSAGLSVSGSQGWHQDSPGILGRPAADDEFGTFVQVYDYDGDGFDDLFSSIPGEGRYGSYSVIRGGRGGVSATNNLLDQFPSPGVAETVCRWACEAAWVLLPPGPACDCDFCSLLGAPAPCPGCA